MCRSQPVEKATCRASRKRWRNCIGRLGDRMLGSKSETLPTGEEELTEMFESKDEPLLLDFSIPMFRDSGPLQIAAFEPGNPVPIRQFTDLGDWRNHVLKLRLSSAVPKAIRDKHDQVLRTLFMAWFYHDVVKLADPGALTVLGRAITMRYSPRGFKSWPTSPLFCPPD